MIVINLKAQYVSLIITVISATFEVALLFAALRWNCFIENRILKRGGKVNLRIHLWRTKLLSVVTAILFLAVEIGNSFYSDPTKITSFEKRPCRFLGAKNFTTDFPEVQNKFNADSLPCLEANETSVTQRGWNQFGINGEVILQCSKELYSFERTSISPEIEDYAVGCIQAGDVNEPKQDICSLVIQNGSRISISTVFQPQMEQKFGQNVSWLNTDVRFDTNTQNVVIATRAASLMARGIRDDVDLRRLIFTEEREGWCDFRIEFDGTALNGAFVIVLVIIWVTCMLLFFGSWIVLSRIEYNMSNPLDWATKTVISEEVVGTKNPEAVRIESDGQLRVVWTNSTEAQGKIGHNLFFCSCFTSTRREKQGTRLESMSAP